MKYKVRYEELYTFEEFVEADSKEEAIAKVKEEKELRFDFEAGGLTDWEDIRLEPIKVEEDPGSYISWSVPL